MNLYATCCESAASSLAVTQYPPIAPSRNQVVKLLPHPGHLVGRAQIMPSGTPNQIHKAKQPQQILPKPIPSNISPQKQSVPRLNTAMPQQTPLLINQPQAQSPTLLLNQVLTSGAPVIVQPAGPGGTVHLMLRTPTPTLQSGPGPPQNKMIITNTTQPQPQATVLIQNRQQVVRFMTAQGPMQLQQIQTPSGPQLIAIPQNQSLSFPPNSVLVQSPATNSLQLQQSSGNPLQLRQSSSAILQSNSFSQGSLQNQISLQNHILQTNPTTPNNAVLKRDEKSSIDHANGLPGANEQKKIVIDNKNFSKKNPNTVSSNISNNFNTGNNNSSNSSNLNNNTLNNVGNSSSAKKNTKTGKKAEEDALSKNVNKNFTKAETISTPVSVATSTAQKNLTSSLRQVRPGAFGNRNKQNQTTEVTKEKTEDANFKSLSNLTKIIDSVASNTEHLSSPPPAKIDNLTATINSVAENIKSPTPDDIMSNLSLSDVFIGNKTLNLNKRPNLTIVQKQKPTAEEPNIAINRLILSPNTGATVDFENIPENYDALELSGLTASAGVQTAESQSFVLDQNNSNQGIFQVQEEVKKGKKKTCNKKKSKKEENRVDLWDLMKSAGIGDDEFDETSDLNTFSQDTATITEPIEISASDSDLLAQLQAATQVPGGIRVVVGEDGRPVIINGSNVLIPETTSNLTGESTDAEAVLQNMILPDNVFNFTPQAFATAQSQLNQLIQDHGGLAPSSSDQQLLSQIFGVTPSSISSSSTSLTTTTTTSTPVVQSSTTLPNAQEQTLPPPCGDSLLVNVGPTCNEVNQPTITVQKQETNSEYIGGPPPGLPPLGPDSLVITNNNGVPTLVASPALMQYLQTHQGIIQFQHDPVTKTLQPSLIIPHPQHKIEPTHSSQDHKTDKLTPVTASNVRNNQNKEPIKPRSESKTSVGTTTDDSKPSLSNVFNVVGANQSLPNVVKLNMAKFVKENPSLLQIATETNNLMSFKEGNKNLSEKEKVEIDKKIMQNRAILDQCFLLENNRGPVSNMESVPNLILKEGGSNDGVTYQVGSFGVVDKLSSTDKTSSETQTLEDLQNLDMTLIKGFHPPPNTNSPTSTSDFQAKFLESIGMANKSSSKVAVNVGTGTNPPPPVTATVQPVKELKKGRKKKDKIQSQATQADVKTDVPSLMFNIPELTPEQNDKLNQALQNRGAIVNHIDNLDAIKQIIHEEVRKITSNSIQNANIRFSNTLNLPTDDHEINDQNISTANVVLSNANINQFLDQGSAGHGSVISLQGNDLVAINSGNQQIFTSQNQLLSGNHFVSSNNQILAIGGSHNQLVSLGNPINSSNQIVTLGSPPNLMSVSGNNVASPGAVIVGNNGNVVAIVHQSPTSGQGSGIVQRIQTIQLSTPKQQIKKVAANLPVTANLNLSNRHLTSHPSHFKTIQNQIQTLTSKTNRTPTEQSTLQKLILEQQKILSTGKLVPAVSGQQIQGMQIVSQSVPNQSRIYQAQTTSQQQSQLSQNQAQQNSQSHQQQSQTFIAGNSNVNVQSSKLSQSVVSCGTSTSDFNSTLQHNIPKMSVPPTVLISDAPTTYGPLYVSPNNSNKNVTKCEKGTSPIQIQMGTQTVTNMEYRCGKMSTGTMTSPNTGKPQAVVAPAIVIQQTESQSPSYQMKARNQTTVNEPIRTQVPALNRTAFIEQQMRTDQAGATMPDTRTPFLSKSDAVKRLIRYHIMDEKALSPQDLATADDIFEATAQHLLDKFRIMKEKYKYLLMLESMREVSTAERIMVDRNFIIEERMELEELREKEKRLQEEFENATITCPTSIDSSVIKTELMLDEVKSEVNDFCGMKAIKTESVDEQDDNLISKSRNSDINSVLIKDSSFKLTEANRNVDLVKIKSETKECKNTRTSGARSRSESPHEEDFPNISSKCKAKSCRTFSDGSSKSSLDSSKDEDSGTDINAQVQSAIDSILNLQKCDALSDSLDDGTSKKVRKKRKFTDKSSESSKKLKIKGFEVRKERDLSEESEDDDDGAGSDADPILDEAIRSILTS